MLVEHMKVVYDMLRSIGLKVDVCHESAFETVVPDELYADFRAVLLHYGLSPDYNMEPVRYGKKQTIYVVFE